MSLTSISSSRQMTKIHWIVWLSLSINITLNVHGCWTSWSAHDDRICFGLKQRIWIGKARSWLRRSVTSSEHTLHEIAVWKIPIYPPKNSDRICRAHGQFIVPQWHKNYKHFGQSKRYPGPTSGLFTRPKPLLLLALWNVKAPDDGSIAAEPQWNFGCDYKTME
jgi:hypothetical protein